MTFNNALIVFILDGCVNLIYLKWPGSKLIKF